SAISAPTLSKYGSLRTVRSAATARSGRSRASNTSARGRMSSSSSSSPMRLTGSSQRSSVRTVAPSWRPVAAAPSSRSSSGPWPITATKVRARLAPIPLPDLGAPNGDAGNLDGGAAHPDRDALAVLAAGPDSIGYGDIVTQHGYLAKCFGTVTDEVHALEGCRNFSVFD